MDNPCDNHREALLLKCRFRASRHALIDGLRCLCLLLELPKFDLLLAAFESGLLQEPSGLHASLLGFLAGCPRCSLVAIRYASKLSTNLAIDLGMRSMICGSRDASFIGGFNLGGFLLQDHRSPSSLEKTSAPDPPESVAKFPDLRLVFAASSLAWACALIGLCCTSRGTDLGNLLLRDEAPDCVETRSFPSCRLQLRGRRRMTSLCNSVSRCLSQ